jgi:hypothetical protein
VVARITVDEPPVPTAMQSSVVAQETPESIPRLVGTADVVQVAPPSVVVTAASAAESPLIWSPTAIQSDTEAHERPKIEVGPGIVPPSFHVLPPSVVVKTFLNPTITHTEIEAQEMLFKPSVPVGTV